MRNIALIALLSFTLSQYAQAQVELVPKNLALLEKLNAIPGNEGVEIRYGYELLTETPKFFGPNGKIFKGTKSRVSCSQCHMEAGTRHFGNSFHDTQATYPQFRLRENKIQTLSDRINACFRHPLLGTRNFPEDGREMRALQIYIKWIGRGRPILEKESDERLMKLTFLDRAADPEKGKFVFEKNCIQCHGINGNGKLSDDQKYYIYPPLWGNESFMIGSSMSRISILARFIKGNMPFGTLPDKPKLSDDETWDVSAYILTHQRPKWAGEVPFSKISNKPFDYPIPPFDDKFTNEQHSRGPFKPILKWQSEISTQGPKSSSMGI
jgi:thiosulfate dehydrogenase